MKTDILLVVALRVVVLRVVVLTVVVDVKFVIFVGCNVLSLQATRFKVIGIQTGFKQHVSARQTLVLVEHVKFAKHGSKDEQENDGAQNT